MRQRCFDTIRVDRNKQIRALIDKRRQVIMSGIDDDSDSDKTSDSGEKMISGDEIESINAEGDAVPKKQLGLKAMSDKLEKMISKSNSILVSNYITSENVNIFVTWK